MANFTAGTSFSDGVTNDVTAAKLNALVADAVPTSNLSLNSTTGTIATLNSTTGTIATLNSTTGTIATLNSTTGTIATLNSTTGTIATLNSTTGTIATLNSTTGTIPTLVATTLITTGTGTAAAPAIVPTGDTNTGIFFPAADTIAFAEGGAEAMRIDSSGNVGVGTASPAYPLAVSSAASTQIQIKAGNANASSLLLGDTDSAAIGRIQYDHGTDSMALWTNSAERLRIDASGNVGIGQSSLTSTLTVNKAGTDTVIQMQEGGTNTAQIESFQSSLYLNVAGANNIIFRPNSTERLRITSDGVVRIGTATQLLTSANILEVSGTNGIGIQATGGAGSPCMLAWNSAASGNNTFAIFYTEASPSSVGSIDFNRASTLTRYNTTSDATLKNIIGDSSGEESVSILKNTKIRDYTWKKDITNKVNVGVVAQELYEVFKGAVSVGGDIVSKDSEGNDITTYRPWGVDKTAFTFHLVAGWKAHEKLIQDLKTENDSLKSRIEALEAA